MGANTFIQIVEALQRSNGIQPNRNRLPGMQNRKYLLTDCNSMWQASNLKASQTSLQSAVSLSFEMAQLDREVSS